MESFLQARNGGKWRKKQVEGLPVPLLWRAGSHGVNPFPRVRGGHEEFVSPEAMQEAADLSGYPAEVSLRPLAKHQLSSS